AVQHGQFGGRTQMGHVVLAVAEPAGQPAAQVTGELAGGQYLDHPGTGPDRRRTPDLTDERLGGGALAHPVHGRPVQRPAHRRVQRTVRRVADRTPTPRARRSRARSAGTGTGRPAAGWAGSRHRMRGRTVRRPRPGRPPRPGTSPRRAGPVASSRPWPAPASCGWTLTDDGDTWILGPMNDRRTFPPPPEPLAVPVPDSHTHLDATLGFGTGGPTGVEHAVELARDVGVDRLVQVGTDVGSSRWACEVAAKHPAVVATVAVHPNDAPRPSNLDGALRDIEALAAQPRVRGVGETGLDTYR